MLQRDSFTQSPESRQALWRESKGFEVASQGSGRPADVPENGADDRRLLSQTASAVAMVTLPRWSTKEAKCGALIGIS